MDINSLLPLLLGKGDAGDKSKLFAALAGGDASAARSAFPNDMSGIMDMLSKGMMKKTRTEHVTGLKAITGFAPADVIGTLVKLMGG